MRKQILFALLFLTFGCKTTSTDPTSHEKGPTGASEYAYEARLVREFKPPVENELAVCTFNIQWVGHWKDKRNKELASTLRHCDVAVIEEMVAPPWEVTVRQGEAVTVLKADAESAAFVDAMKAEGFDGIDLSPEDTGPNRNHTNGTASEWYIMFFKSQKVELAQDLPKGFLSQVLAKNPHYTRVPYAFPLRAKHKGRPSVDFVLIAVHLHATNTSNEPLSRSKAKRVREFRRINDWIIKQKRNHASREKDFFILGDMNIEDLDEMKAFFGEPSPVIAKEIETLRVMEQPPLDEQLVAQETRKIRSMNRTSQGSQPTNIGKTKAYDHVMFHQDITAEVMPELEIFDLSGVFNLPSFATSRAFVQAYSDHKPLRFRIKLGEDRD